MSASILWLGRDCKFVWRRASSTGSSELGSEPAGANAGAPDPAIDYLVRIERPDGTVLRESYTPNNEYTYTYERNFEDTGGAPVRSFTFKVLARIVSALSQIPAQISVSNPAPDVPGAISAQAGADNITVSCSFPPDTDVAGMLVWRSTAGGFTPSSANLVYKGPNSTVALTGLAPNNQYFFRLAAFDTFGTDQLNISNEFSALTAFNVSQLSVITQDLGDITAGSIRGVNVNASSHTTKGSYLTSALAGGEAVLSVRNTADFLGGGGSGWIIDTLNDRNAFSYTGKTATMLTGCTGALAHNNGATIIPVSKGILIDAATNEARFYGDRGDGTIEELACIGITPSGGLNIVGDFGTTNLGNSRVGLVGRTDSNIGVYGSANSGAGVVGDSVSGYGAQFSGNGTRGNLRLVTLFSFPSDLGSNQYAQINGRLYVSDGTHWLPITMPYFESSELTITVSTDTAAAHGLTGGTGAGRTPSLTRGYLRCKTAEFGYAVGDEVATDFAESAGTNRGLSVYANTSNVGFVVGTQGAFVLRRDAGNIGNAGVITPGNWRVILRAW